MIFHGQSVTQGAKDGVQFCIQVVIPSLFPYFFLCDILTTSMTGRWSLCLTGFLGGYPAGAQAIATACADGEINKKQAEYMLPYFNNAGPAFIFGVLSQLFRRWYIPLIIWTIHLVSVIPVYLCFHQNYSLKQITCKGKEPSINKSLQTATKSIVIVCGWVFLFRTVLSVTSNSVFANISTGISVVVSGLLELTNGCYALFDVTSEPFCFIVSTTLIGFGGLCVTMQTRSIAGGIGIRPYVVGKLLHASTSFLISGVVSKILF